ncbi:unnamed protein product [Schistosoma curassoni]|uniref:Uncharacterized protein n=1 Tax=Schistosoma curassoni TaxID=6186 RepID=A0A183KFF0_9TREM|nr:unnamed protein product [Schistosoma curassoni]
MEQLDIHSASEAFEDYLERFEIWSITKQDVKEKPISFPYATLKELLLIHVKCTSIECRERAKFHKMFRRNDQKFREIILVLKKQAAKLNFGINIPGLERELLRMPNCSFQDARAGCTNYEAVNELDIQSMKISNILLDRHDELQSQSQSHLRSFNNDAYSRVNMKGVSTRNYKANHKATVHFASSCTKSCNLNFNNSDVYSDHLSSSTISKGNAHIQKRLYTSLGPCHGFIVDTGTWGTPIVTPPKSGGKTPKICGDYRFTLNFRSLKQTCTTVDAEDILNRLHGSKLFSIMRILDINDLSRHSRHVDQIQFQEQGESIPISVVNPNANE